MPSTDPHIYSGIRDNHRRGTVGDFLRTELRAGADLDIVSAYFTVFAHDKLKTQLDSLGRIRLLFGEAAFIKTIDPDHTHGAAYVLRDDGLALAAPPPAPTSSPSSNRRAACKDKGCMTNAENLKP